MTISTDQKKLLAAAINKIIAEPACWNQNKWHCGTQHSFGGQIQMLGGLPMRETYVRQDVEKLTGLPASDVYWLCEPTRTLDELYAYVSAVVSDRADFGCDGFDSEGFDSDGFDRDGRDREGRDIHGVTLTPIVVPEAADSV